MVIFHGFSPNWCLYLSLGVARGSSGNRRPTGRTPAPDNASYKMNAISRARVVSEATGRCRFAPPFATTAADDRGHVAIS